MGLSGIEGRSRWRLTSALPGETFAPNVSRVAEILSQNYL